jgi:hypothetical protein
MKINRNIDTYMSRELPNLLSCFEYSKLEMNEIIEN